MATHLVQQLWTLARLDPTKWEAGDEQIDLDALASERLAALSPLAMEKEIEISLSVTGNTLLNTDKVMMDVLITNLVGNAIKYTPDHGVVEVTFEGRDKLLEFCVHDSGEGIPESDRELVFERFYRRERGSIPGCGLGLSIVYRIIEILGGEIRMDESPLGGLLVVVRLPLTR